MRKSSSSIYWLITNFVLIGGSLFTTWFIWGFDPPPDRVHVAGWKFFSLQVYALLSWADQDRSTFALIMASLKTIAGLFIVFYFGYKFLNKALPSEVSGSKVTSTILIMITCVFFIEFLTYRKLYHPLPGYWIFVLGLISSAVFEWKKAPPGKEL